MLLTLKQETFCRKVIEFNDDASMAYRHAYNAEKMKPATINRAAKELMDNPKIAARITELKEVILKKLDVGPERVIEEIARVSFSDVRKLFRENGSLIPIHELDDDTAAAVCSFKVKTLSAPGKEDTAVDCVTEIKFWDKNSSLEKLGKHAGIFEKDNSQKNDPLSAFLSDIAKRSPGVFKLIKDEDAD